MLKYPKFIKSEKKTNYFGKIISEPYENLEKLNSMETIQWIESENKLSSKFFLNSKIHENIKSKLNLLWDFPKESSPIRAGNYYYYFKNLGLLNQSILYRKENLADFEEELFLDPNSFSKNQTATLSSISFSKNGNYLAYSISRNGSIYSEILIINTRTKKILDEKISEIPFDSSVGFNKVIWNGNGFFYSKFDKGDILAKYRSKNKNARIYYHKIESDYKFDKLIYEDKKNPQIAFGISSSYDEKYLYIYPSFGNHLNSIIVRNNLDLRVNLKYIINDYKFESEVIYSNGDYIYILTNRNNSNKAVFKIDLNDFVESNWEVVLPENEFFLDEVFFFNNKFICHYLKNASSKLEIYDENFNFESEIKLPTLGTIFNFSYDNLKKDLYFSFTSFIFANIILKYSFNDNLVSTYRESFFKFDFSKYETKQIWYESKDKTKIPMFIVKKKDLKLNGKNPTMLYGYGGFNISITPFFSIANILFLENGGIFAIPNLRGGGEFGRKWHEMGILENKQNVFDDFISASLYLIENNYTCSNKLAIFGGSNGGLLVGACLVQRPELFRVAIPVVGVLDMLKYHKFGADWVSDYGCSENENDFNYLIKYSPIHNVKSLKYPSVLIMTSNCDDNVTPSHSYKFAAILQEKNLSENPILLRVELGSGHQGGSSTQRQIDEIADRLTFLFNELGMNFN